jgi:hypothetical protein
MLFPREVVLRFPALPVAGVLCVLNPSSRDLRSELKESMRGGSAPAGLPLEKANRYEDHGVAASRPLNSTPNPVITSVAGFEPSLSLFVLLMKIFGVEVGFQRQLC